MTSERETYVYIQLSGLPLQRKRNTIPAMKTAILPQVRGAVEFRRTQSEFHARGEAAWQEYQRTGASFPASQVVDELRGMLEAKREQVP